MQRIVCFMQSLLIYMLITPKKYLRATSKVVLDQTTGRRNLAKVTHEADQHRHDQDKGRNTAYTDNSCFLNPPAETTMWPCGFLLLFISNWLLILTLVRLGFRHGYTLRVLCTA